MQLALLLDTSSSDQIGGSPLEADAIQSVNLGAIVGSVVAVAVVAAIILAFLVSPNLRQKVFKFEGAALAAKRIQVRAATRQAEEQAAAAAAKSHAPSMAPPVQQKQRAESAWTTGHARNSVVVNQ